MGLFSEEDTIFILLINAIKIIAIMARLVVLTVMDFMRTIRKREQHYSEQTISISLK